MPDRACRVVAIGEIVWDLLPTGPRLGGAPFNATAHLSRFGCDAWYVTAVGDDELGRSAIAEADRLGVHPELIQTVPAPTGLVRVRIDASGVPDYEIASPAAYERIAPLSARDLDRVADVDLFVFGTLAQRFAGAREATAQLAHASGGAPSLYDVNLRPGCWDVSLVAELLDVATILKLNEHELLTVAEVLDVPTDSTERFARTIADRHGLRAVCVTRGARGAALLLDGVFEEAGSPPVAVVDTVGAGDAFAACLGYGVVHAWTVSEILSVANALGALVASSAGAIPDWDRAALGIPTDRS